MRKIFTPLLCLAVLAAAPLSAKDADEKAIPLYLQFRVLSGLPWKESGTTRKTVLERIFQEPHPLVRREVLREYLHTVLPAEDFPAAFAECLALEQADFPGAVPEFVMRAWAERDLATALKHCETLFDLIIEGAPLRFDSWSTSIRVGNLEKARTSSYWFGSRGVVHACWKGLTAAVLPPMRRKELEAAFTEDYVRRFQEKPPGDIEEPAQLWARHYQSSYVENPPTISSDAGMRAEFLVLLAASPEQISGTLKWPGEPWKDVTFSRALIRWMNGDAMKARQILERILDAYDPRRYYRDDSAVMDVIPAEFLVEWAILDRAGFIAWAGQHSRGWRAYAVLMAVVPKENEREAASWLQQLRDKAQKSKFHELSITLDPHRALTRPSRYGDESDIGTALDDLWRSDPPANYWRSAISPYIKLDRCSGTNEAWGVTTTWAPVDFIGMVKRYGLPWCLRYEEFEESQVPRMFSNREAMANESGLRNTVSALRTWAILRPKEMRGWIDSETFSSDLRTALLWLLDNASGGIAVPVPAKVP